MLKNQWRLTIVKELVYSNMPRAISILSPILVVPYLMNSFSARIYGVYIFSRSISLLIRNTSMYGFNITSIRDLNIQNSSDNGQYVVSSFIIRMILYILLTVLCIVSMCFLEYPGKALFLYIAIGYFMDLLSPLSLFYFTNKVLKANVYVGVMAGLKVILIFIIISPGSRIENLLAIDIICFTGLTIALWAKIKNIIDIKFRVSSDYIRGLIRRNFRFALSDIIAKLCTSNHRFYAGLLFPPESLPPLEFAVQMINVVKSPFLHLNSILLSRATELFSNKKFLYIFSGIIYFVLVLFLSGLISYIHEVRFAEAFGWYRWLLIDGLILTVGIISGSLLLNANRDKEYNNAMYAGALTYILILGFSLIDNRWFILTLFIPNMATVFTQVVFFQKMKFT